MTKLKKRPSRRIVGNVVRTLTSYHAPIWAPSEELPDGGVYIPGVIGWQTVPRGTTGLAVRRVPRGHIEVLVPDGGLVAIPTHRLEVVSQCNSDGDEVSYQCPINERSKEI